MIDHDGFALDDRRACRVEASRGLRVLLVDGDPRTVRTEDEVFFLEAALRAGGSNFSVTTVLPDDLGEPRSRRLRRRVHGQRRPAERRGRGGHHALRGGRRRPVHLGRRSRRRRCLEPDDEGRAAAAARAQAQRRRAARRAARGRDRRSAPGRAAGADRSPPPAAGGVPGARRGAGVGALLPVPAARAAAGGARPAHRAALRERRARAGRRRGGPRPGPAADDVGRSRVDGPADPARLPAAGAGGGALPRGGAVGRRDGDGHRRRQARDRAGRGRPAHRDRQAERRIALAHARRRTRASSERGTR